MGNAAVARAMHRAQCPRLFLIPRCLLSVPYFTFSAPEGRCYGDRGAVRRGKSRTMTAMGRPLRRLAGCTLHARSPTPRNPTMNAPREAPPAAQSSEEALLAMRRSKAEALRARGENPSPNAIDTAQRAWLGSLRAR